MRPDPAPGRTVPAVQRAAALLDHVATVAQAPTLSELSRALDLPKSSTHGICQTLVSLGLLLQDAAGRFRIGPQVMVWAGAFQEQSDLVSAFREIVTGETALAAHTLTLSVLEGGDVVYLACRNGSAPLGVTFRIGMRLPAPFTATGKAMLAARTGPLPTALAGPGWPAPLTARSVPDAAALVRELDATRARGHSFEEGQVREGMVCFGAPVIWAEGQVVAGIALSLPGIEADADRRAMLGTEIARMAMVLSRRIGWTGASWFGAT